MIAPQVVEIFFLGTDTRVLDHFLRRISASVSRSPLLRVRLSRRGRLLDCSQLNVVQADLPWQLLYAVVQGHNTVTIDLRLRVHKTAGASRLESTQIQLFAPGEKDKTEDELVRAHQFLYESFKRIIRHTELVRRETGVNSLWFGYPLLFAAADVQEPDQVILAPVFLWPISIELDLRHEGRIRVRRPQGTCPQFNRVMSVWLRRRLSVALQEPSEDDLLALDLEGLEKYLGNLSRQFQNTPTPQWNPPLEPVPDLKMLKLEQGVCFHNSSVLGYFHWQNQAILRDLEVIKAGGECRGVVTAFVSGREISEPVRLDPPGEEDRFLVCAADFSQERVVWQARAKPGLVVHGPPGTGKSQTIVNIIADALAHDRTVLMLCQKRVATRVVLERLKAAGLAGLCVEAHDVESDRLAVFRNIRDQVDRLPRAPEETRGEPRRKEVARQIGALEAELDQYARALYERHHKVGLSYRDVKAREGRIYADWPTVRTVDFLQDFLTGISSQELDELCRRVETVGRLFRQGGPLSNPWAFRCATVRMSRSLRQDVGVTLKHLRELDDRQTDLIREYGAGTPLPPDVSSFSATASKAVKLLAPLADRPDWAMAKLVRGWVMTVRNGDERETTRERARCEEASNLASKLAEPPAPRNRWWRFLSAPLRPVRGWLRKVRLTHLVGTMRLQSRPCKGKEVPFARLAWSAFQKAEWMVQRERQNPWMESLILALMERRHTARLRDLLAKMEQSLQRVPFATDLLRVLSELESFLTPEGLAEPRNRILAGQSIREWADRLEGGLEGLQALVVLDMDRQRREGHVKVLLDALEDYEKRAAGDEKLPAPPLDLPEAEYGRWWVALVRYTAARAWLEACHLEQPVLLEITPEVHEGKRRELGDLLRKKRKLEAEVIRERWLKQQVECRGAPWKRMFQLRRSKYGDGKRLREAVELGLPEGLLKMRPCWLTNPAAAAQIFPLKPELFDLVIFDEASQCPIEQAVPAIYRGKVLVVAGDEKQLPPTSFFSARPEYDEPEDEDAGDQEATNSPVESRRRKLEQLGEQDLLQVEDLLEAAVGALPPRSVEWLLVHYRSEHPDLIQFSNAAFYDGRLEAPPFWRGSRADYRPIIYHDVGGTYAARTNRDEARKVVELLREFWLRDESASTIGIVTFNMPQRDLIEDLIQEECHRDDAFAVRYQQQVDRQESNQDIGFFVKNLENVQGDERDVMIFSTTFGRDGSGRFYRRFGPVGAQGGERRLNVAVTRAKRQVIIVGSMPIADISPALRANGAVGSSLTPAGYLQLYLAYAQAISGDDSGRAKHVLGSLRAQPAPAEPLGEPESPFEEEVKEVLERMGHTVHSQVGDVGFRIDLAVLHPEPKCGYMLGIECDGATYHSDRSAHIRDVWREDILRRRGWKIHRIWSTRWWSYRDEEMKKLNRAISQALQRAW